jgi:hypothetical protein
MPVLNPAIKQVIEQFEQISDLSPQNNNMDEGLDNFVDEAVQAVRAKENRIRKKVDI